MRVNTINYKKNEIGLLLILFVLMIIFSVFSQSFFSAKNLMQVLAQMAELSLLTLAMSVCLISGGFDLSIGAMTGLGSVSIAILLRSGMNMWFSIMLVMVLLALWGTINGFLVGFLKINSMLATLGTSSLITGLALVFSKGIAISGLPNEFFIFGQYYIGIVPLQVIIIIGVLIISIVLLNYSKWGRNVYLIGSSPKVARFSGINYEKNTMLVYIYSSILSCLASIILTARLSTGRADLGDAYVMQSVTAAIFGGISIKGGTGNLIGAILGVIIFSVISNGLNMLNFSQYLQQIVIGSVFIIVLFFRVYKNHK